MVKKHVKPNPQRKIEGGIMQREASIHISNVALLNLTTNQPDRVGFKWVGEGDNKRKVRYFKSNEEIVEATDYKRVIDEYFTNTIYGKIVPQLHKEFNYSSVMQVPRIIKITLNMGVGEAVGG